MISRFAIHFRCLALLTGAVFAGCEQPEATDAEAGSMRRADTYEGEVHTCSSTQESAALGEVNRVRDQAGVKPFACLSALSAMAAAHAHFLAENEDLRLASGHREAAGHPGYTGETLGERAAYQDLDTASFWLSEGVGGGERPQDVLDAHLGTVFHRSALLAPGGRYFAFAAEKALAPHAVMNMLIWVTVDGLDPVTWPADGAVDVSPSFTPAGEIPEPVPDAARAGFPVSVHFPRHLGDDGVEPTLGVEAFVLTDGGGSEISARLITASTDARVYGSDAFLVPLAKLAAGARYVARAKLRYGKFVFDRSWAFTTAPESQSSYRK